MAERKGQTAPATGGCLCGAVRYRVDGPLRPVIACHCEQCRRTSGHHVAATACAPGDLTLIEARGLTWFASSDVAERGFCRVCGGNLFYRRRDPTAAPLSIMAGTLDRPSGLKTAFHIFTAGKADYYDIADDVPRRAHGIDGDPVA